MITKRFCFINIVVFLLLGLTAIGHAADNGYILLAPSIVGDTSNNPVDLLEYSRSLFNTVLVVVIFLAVLMMIIGGFQYILSYVPGQKQEGANKITNAIIGLIVALISYLLLVTINPQLIEFKSFFFN